jgi:thioredoxin 1
MPDEELDKIMEKKYKEMIKNGNSANTNVPEASGKILYDLGDSSFDKFLEYKKDIAVDFYADWCGPCKIMSPIFDEVAKEISPKVTFAKVNVDDSPNMAEKFSIMGVPTVLYFKNSGLVDKTVGAIPKNAFRNKVKEIYGI